MNTKTKATHTPGVWHRNIRANGKYPVVFAGRNRHVAIVQQQKDSDETEANIDLIAAAPEMLRALELLMDVVPNYHDDREARDRVEFARDTIRKARGEDVPRTQPVIIGVDLATDSGE